MSKLPSPIELTEETNEGYTLPLAHDEVIRELVEKFNQLLAYLEEEASNE